jgi:hypothetical protein
MASHLASYRARKLLDGTAQSEILRSMPTTGLRIEFWKDRRILEIIQKSGPESNAGGRILRRDCRS